MDPLETSSKYPHTRAQLVAIARQCKHHDPLLNADDSRLVPNSLLQKVVSLLANENDDVLQSLLKETFAIDDNTLDQHVLDLMHKHRDDMAGVPFLFLTPTKRPVSRSSSRASTQSYSARLYPARPDTPASASAPPSPLAFVFRRPHTPVASPLAATATSANSYITAKSDNTISPQSSPILAHAQATQAHAQFTASLPSSPLSSPRLLSARASEFKPIPRPLSAASSNPGSLLRADSPSPDLWASPRTSSNLAIAAPLIAGRDHSATPPRDGTSSSLRSSLLPGDEDEDDPFNPFSTKPFPLSFHPLSISDSDITWDSSDLSRSPDDHTQPLSHSPWQNTYGYFPPEPNGFGSSSMDLIDDTEANSILTDGMTPFDVLSSVFGSSLAPSELEEALANNGYDFERAMAWLVDKAPPSSPQPSPIRMQSMGSRVMLVSREAQPNLRGGRGTYPIPIPSSSRPGQRYSNNGRPSQAATRVCRYYLAGECLRADCRFSHELERALCRFWLRGTCAKQENCEFMHHLPKDADITHVNAIIARATVPPNPGPLPPHAMPNNPTEDFPVLGYDNANGKGKPNHGRFDPSRTRFSAAVKKPASSVPPQNDLARREAMGPSADNLYNLSTIVAPRPSPRIKLRSASLLPTLPTGESVNKLYMAYRQRGLQLGAARNACLSRAADAWRRGDGAAAKKFSKEGHEMNTKMKGEMTNAASKLVRERVKVAEQAVRSRDTSWSDDPGDRTSRGKTIGGGLGICLGVASTTIGEGKLTPEERTECVLDLHGLHSNEATEVLEEFLLSLEKGHFLGLAYIVVGEEKHTGTQDLARGTSRMRLATGVREWIHRWGYPWSERDGIICVDPLTHASE
ncbi:hypothetical protein JOM56_007350 [Amanita muscaria]